MRRENGTMLSLDAECSESKLDVKGLYDGRMQNDTS